MLDGWSAEPPHHTIYFLAVLTHPDIFTPMVTHSQLDGQGVFQAVLGSPEPDENAPPPSLVVVMASDAALSKGASKGI